MYTLGLGILIVNWLSSPESTGDAEPPADPTVLLRSSTGSIGGVREGAGFVAPAAGYTDGLRARLRWRAVSRVEAAEVKLTWHARALEEGPLAPLR